MAVFLSYFKGQDEYARPVRTAEEFFALRSEPEHLNNLTKVREGDEAKKKNLTAFFYSAFFGEEGGPVRGANTPDYEANTIYTDYDCPKIDGETADDYAKRCDEFLQKVISAVLEHKDDIDLVFGQKSARRHGVGIVCMRRPELSHKENLSRIDEILGFEHDKYANNINRKNFATGPSIGTGPEDDIFFIDDRLFILEPCPKVERKSDRKKAEEEEERVIDPVMVSMVWNGFPLPQIWEKYREMYNGGKPVVEGMRNTKVHEFAVHLKKKCESLNELLTVTPNFFGEEGREEFNQCVSGVWNSSFEAEDNRIDAVLAALRQEQGSDEDVPPHLEIQYYPSLMKLLASKVPDYYKGVVASNQFAALATWLGDVQFEHWLDGPREIGFFQLLIGEQGTGKSLINRPYEAILEKIRQQDEKQREREREWRMKNYGKQEKEPQPRGLVQIMPHSVTAAKFVERLEDAERAGKKHLNIKVDEIELLAKMAGNSKANIKTLITIAYDRGLWGSDTKSSDGAQGNSALRADFHASTTPLGADSFFDVSDAEKGIQRRTAAWPLLRPKDRKIKPKQEEYDQAYKDALKPYLERLSQATGKILIPENNKFCDQILDELGEMIDAAKEPYWHAYAQTAVMYGWMKGCILYIAEGEWNKKIERFVRWSIYTQLWTMRRFFGIKIVEAAKKNKKSQTFSSKPTMLDMLPDSFIIEDVKKLRQKQKMTASAKYQISNWRKRGLIVKDEATGKYVKTSKGKRLV